MEDGEGVVDCEAVSSNLAQRGIDDSLRLSNSRNQSFSFADSLGDVSFSSFRVTRAAASNVGLNSLRKLRVATL